MLVPDPPVVTDLTVGTERVMTARTELTDYSGRSSRQTQMQ